MSHEQELKQLCDDYGATLPAKIEDILSDCKQLKQQLDLELLKELIRKVHSLIGAGATFGYSALSTTATDLELELRNYQKQPNLSSFDTDSLDALLTALETAALQPCDYHISSGKASAFPLSSTVSDNDIAPSTLIISSNRQFYTDLSNRLNAFNIKSHVFDLSSDLLAAIERINPSYILFELNSLQDQGREIDIIKDIKCRLIEAPILIVISNYHEMAIRLSAVRAGASAYFLAPVNVTELATFIRAHLKANSESPYRIMIVDDDEHFAHHTALLLQRSGMKTNVVTNPLNILEALADFQPELILLDLYMPECDGIELATIIRQQCIYAGIAIVFFSVETDIQRHIDALRTGGDDFLIKSMEPKQLIAKVEAKAKNARAVQNMMLHDGLTGVLNRSHFMETINRQIAICQRSNNCFSYVMLDIDHFKVINDQYGHQMGDEVLRSLAALITQRLRSVDSVIRYGGEEFVILLPDTHSDQAKLIILDLLKKFSALEFTLDDQSFYVTFSAGIAQYPNFPDPSSLAEAADKALYQAKQAGRNQVCLA